MSTSDDSTQHDQSISSMDDDSLGTPSAAVSPATDDSPNVLRCFICREPPWDPISTFCGHVCCWRCMHQWLQNGPKPCPACGHTIQRDLNVIPLYLAGASIYTRTGAGTSQAIDIPPRPRNPLLYPATSTPNNYGSENSNLTSPSSFDFDFVLMASRVKAGYERAIGLLSQYEEKERKRVMRMRTNLTDLERQLSKSERRHAELRREARDRESVLGQERDEEARVVRALEDCNRRLASEAEAEEAEAREREWGHMQRATEMAELMATLERSLDQADLELPDGWSDSIGDESIGVRGGWLFRS